MKMGGAIIHCLKKPGKKKTTNLFVSSGRITINYVWQIKVQMVLFCTVKYAVVLKEMGLE